MTLDGIGVSQDDVISYYEGRNAEFAKDGLTGLKLSNAAVYYVPFESALGLHFKLGGQCIPNR